MLDYFAPKLIFGCGRCGCGQLWLWSIVVVVKSSCGQHVSVLELEKQRHDVDSSSRRCLSQRHNVTMSQHVQQLKVQPIQCNETMMLNSIDLKRVMAEQKFKHVDGALIHRLLQVSDIEMHIKTFLTAMQQKLLCQLF